MEPAGTGVRGMGLRLEIRPYAFALRQPLHTAAAVLHQRCGWLLRLEASDGRLGWGEVAPLMPCLLYTSPSPRDGLLSRMPSSA